IRPNMLNDKKGSRKAGRQHPDDPSQSIQSAGRGGEHNYVTTHHIARYHGLERGVMPANIAMEIARAPDGDIQHALAGAYENKLLPGNQIRAIRRIILRRNQRSKSAPRKGRGIPHTGKIVARTADEGFALCRERGEFLLEPSAALAAPVALRR
ncbi:MAG TPA: hypothetical protein VHY78_10260, partial [Stellaceae bacterium]|nr:hypothetical protein [Stellaceae bacterium]